MSFERTNSERSACWSTACRVIFSFMCIAPALPIFAADRAHVVILAIDDSGSMKQTDPQRMRIEAAEMLAASGSTSDQIGVLKFGDSASWLVQPAPLAATATIDSLLAQLTSTDQHTNFVAPLQLITQYLDGRGSYFKNYDVSVVLMTDGAPDPGPQYNGNAKQNRIQSVELGQALASRGAHVYTIGLGSAVESEFLKALASSADGLYAPARTPSELRDAFLKAATRIFSLPAYEQIDGTRQPRVHVGPKAEIVRAYLFRQNSGTSLAGEVKELFASEHIATYDLPKDPDVTFQIAGALNSATVIVCVKQPLSFAEVSAIPRALLVDSTPGVQFQLLGGGEPQWDRLFMRDAAVVVQLRSSGQPDIVGPLYPDSDGRDYRGVIPTSRAGEFDANVRMESPYGAVDYFYTKLRVADTAVEVPPQVFIRYPSFLPSSIHRMFGTNVPVRYLLSSGSARIAFAPSSSVSASKPVVDIAPGQDRAIKLIAGDGVPSGTVALPYTVTWTDGQQQQARRGLLTLEISPEGPVEFARHHWIVLSLVLVASMLAFIYGPKPKLKGVLVIEQEGGRKRVVLDDLKAKRVTVAESADRESLNSIPVLVRTGSNRELFTLRMAKVNGAWGPQVERADGAPLELSPTMKRGTTIKVKDRELKFTLY